MLCYKQKKPQSRLLFFSKSHPSHPSLCSKMLLQTQFFYYASNQSCTPWSCRPSRCRKSHKYTQCGMQSCLVAGSFRHAQTQTHARCFSAVDTPTMPRTLAMLATCCKLAPFSNTCIDKRWTTTHG